VFASYFVTAIRKFLLLVILLIRDSDHDGCFIRQISYENSPYTGMW
jgi:hypothetical protein